MKNVTIAIVVLIIVIAGAFAFYLSNSGENLNNVEDMSSVETKDEIKTIKITTNELLEMSKEKDYQLINVHTPYVGEIDGTDSFIPFNGIEENLDKLPSDKNAKLVIYCRSGGMSAIATAKLIELGYTNVYDLQGGMNAWTEIGEEIIQK